MNAQVLSFGKITVMLQPAKEMDYVEVSSGGTVETSSKGILKLPPLGALISGIAENLGKSLDVVADSLAPDEVSIEFNFGIKEGCDVWFANVEGNQSIGVKMTWKKTSEAGIKD